MAIEQSGSAHVETKILDENAGIVEALVAVTGNEDSGADIITPGAVKWDSKQPPKVLYGHDTSKVIGKTLEMEELLPGDSRLPVDLVKNGWGALRVKAQLNLDKQVARDALSDLKFHNDDGFQWSIGYETRKKQYKAGVRHLNEIVVREYSALPFGMNSETRTLSAKARLQDVLEEAKALMAEIESKNGDDTQNPIQDPIEEPIREDIEAEPDGTDTDVSVSEAESEGGVDEPKVQDEDQLEDDEADEKATPPQETKAGATISAANMAKLTAAMTAMSEAVDNLEAVMGTMMGLPAEEEPEMDASKSDTPAAITDDATVVITMEESAEFDRLVAELAAV